jgi:hypothetical protein
VTQALREIEPQQSTIKMKRESAKASSVRLLLLLGDSIETVKKRFHGLGAVRAIAIYGAIPADRTCPGTFGILDHPAGTDRLRDRDTPGFVLRRAGLQTPAGKQRQQAADSFHVESEVINHVLDNFNPPDIGP